MDDAASLFWDKYILKTTAYNVAEGARRWYVRHAEDFITPQSGRRLTTLTADDIEYYLKTKGRSEKLADRPLKQRVDALRILFTGIVSPGWPNHFDWAGWMALENYLLIMRLLRDTPKKEIVAVCKEDLHTSIAANYSDRY